MRKTARHYRIEPIVDLRPGQNERYGELLCGSRPGRMPRTRFGWRRWYARLPDMLEDAFAGQRYDRLSVNLDVRHILDHRILSIFDTLGGYPLALEWTERPEARFDPGVFREVGRRLGRLRARYGFHIALDDMGDGIDGLRRLASVEPDWVKIDGALFRLAITDPRIFSMLRAQVTMYRGLGAEVVVEWIENTRDVAMACRLGADRAQGRLWDRIPSTPICQGRGVCADCRHPGGPAQEDQDDEALRTIRELFKTLHQ